MKKTSVTVKILYIFFWFTIDIILDKQIYHIECFKNSYTLYQMNTFRSFSKLVKSHSNFKKKYYLKKLNHFLTKRRRKHRK